MVWGSVESMSKKRQAKTAKTNAMRQLDRAGIPYGTSSYDSSGGLDALHVAEALGIPAGQIFKTIVLEAPDKQHFVAVLPGDDELDLKKLAARAGVKSVQLYNWRELKALTGYVRGGCSPMAMKKAFPTFIDNSAEGWERIFVSAGEIGQQIVLSPADLARATDGTFADLCQG